MLLVVVAVFVDLFEMMAFNTAPMAVLILSGVAIVAQFVVPGEGRWSRVPLVLATLATAIGIWTVWPWNANHSLLTFGLVASATLVAPGRSSSLADWRDGCIVLLGVAVFLTGAQKLLYGTYFNAHALIWPEHFEWVLRVFVSEETLTVLGDVRNAQEPGSVDLQAPLLIAASNSVWAIEVVAGLGLLWKHTRRVALYLFLALMVPTQLAANELGFAAILLPYAAIVDEGHERIWVRAALLLCVAFLLAMVWRMQ